MIRRPRARSPVCVERRSPALDESPGRYPAAVPGLGAHRAAAVVARWMRRCIDDGDVPHLITFPSSAAAVAGAAVEAGIGLAGAQMSIGGEPIRARAWRPSAPPAPRPCPTTAPPNRVESGTAVWPRRRGMTFTSSTISTPSWRRRRARRVRSPRARSSSPRSVPRPQVVMLNVLARRRGGGRAPAVRVSAGRAGIDASPSGNPESREADRGRDESPRRRRHRHPRGGAPRALRGDATDYQLIEQEDASGRPRLVLVVSPRVGEVSPEAVASVFLERIGPGAGVDRITGLLWRDAGVIRVERRQPVVGSSGKVLHYLGGRAMSPTTRTRTRSELPGR